MWTHSSTTTLSTEGSYCLCLAADMPAKMVAAATSQQRIELYDRHTMQPLQSLSTQGRVNELSFATTSSILFSASSDGLVRAWDTRAGSGDSVVAMQDTEQPSDEVWSVALASGHLVAAGTESCVLLWDVRKPSTTRCRWEVHTEAVTQVRFSVDSNGSTLFSGSVDGLICELDCNQTEEDDVVVGVCNAETPITSLGVYKVGPSLHGFCISSLETLSIWDLQSRDRLANLNRIRGADEGEFSRSIEGRFKQYALRLVRVSASSAPTIPRAHTPGGSDQSSPAVMEQVDYLVGCQWDEQNQQLMMFTGAHDGTLHISAVESTAYGALNKQVAASSNGLSTHTLRASKAIGHSVSAVSNTSQEDLVADVRCCIWGHDWLMTGGEDGRICTWGRNDPSPSLDIGVSDRRAKKKQRTKQEKLRHAPY